MKNFCLNLSYFESVEQYKQELLLVKSNVKKRIKEINKDRIPEIIFNDINGMAFVGIGIGIITTIVSKIKQANGDLTQPCNLYLGLTIGLACLTVLSNLGYAYFFLRDEELEGEKAELKEINKQLRILKKVGNC